MFQFTIPGRAVPLQRPRINIGMVKRWRPGIHMGALVYTPSVCKKWQKYVQTIVSNLKAKSEIATGKIVWFNHPIKVTVSFFIKRPGTNSKFAHRPDIDNYTKNLLDALDGFLWEDDAFVTRLVATKSFVDKKEQERTCVTVCG